MDDSLTLREFISFCGGGKKITLCPEDKLAVLRGRATLETLQEKGSVYGTNTGVGPFFNQAVAPDDVNEFQRRLLLSHASGVGPLLLREEVRGMMLLLINMLRKGYSGISWQTLEFLVDLFNRDIIPAIPSQGSLGASGDLAPLAHLALVLIGEGRVLLDDGRKGKAAPAKFVPEFAQGTLRPSNLQSGEALALINGTHMMTSLLAHTVHRAEILSKTADIIAVLTLLALKANREALSAIFSHVKLHPGQRETACNIAVLLKDIEEMASENIQDGYSLRCIPQVHGAVKEAIVHAGSVAEREMNSVSGNPIFMYGKVFHGGNFHGHPLALSSDFLSIALTTLGGISQCRINRLLDTTLSAGLPPYLASESEKGDCGLMMLQYTAAALLSENKTLSHPASVDSIPTAGGQEDYVSMGALAARKAKEICTNTQKILAIELLCAFRALDLSRRFKNDYPNFLWAIRAIMQKNVSYQYLDKDIENLTQVIESGKILEEVEKCASFQMR